MTERTEHIALLMREKGISRETARCWLNEEGSLGGALRRKKLTPSQVARAGRMAPGNPYNNFKLPGSKEFTGKPRQVGK